VPVNHLRRLAAIDTGRIGKAAQIIETFWGDRLSVGCERGSFNHLVAPVFV
jgi:hypothetical protein